MLLQVSVAVYIPAPAGTAEAAAAASLVRRYVEKLASEDELAASGAAAGTLDAAVGAPPASAAGTAAAVGTSSDAEGGEARCAAAARLACEGAAFGHGGEAPMPRLTVSLLYANHFAREGASVLAAERLGNPYNRPLSTAAPAVVAADPAGTHSYDMLYPINALRNAAIAASWTDLLMLVDGDFVPSLGAAAEAAATFLRLQGPQSPGIARPPRTALVLPAFELPATGSGSDNGSSTGGGGSSGGGGASTEAARKPPRTKRALATLWRNGGVRAFHCGAWPPAAPSVDLGAWMTAADSDGGAGTAALLEAPFYEYWEPVVVASRGTGLPCYDPSFKGYGLNKVQHATHMHVLGFRFLVWPLTHARIGSKEGAGTVSEWG